MTTLGSIKTDRDDSPAFKSVNFLFRRANIIIYIYIAYMSYLILICRVPVRAVTLRKEEICAFTNDVHR